MSINHRILFLFIGVSRFNCFFTFWWLLFDNPLRLWFVDNPFQRFPWRFLGNWYSWTLQQCFWSRWSGFTGGRFGRFPRQSSLVCHFHWIRILFLIIWAGGPRRWGDRSDALGEANLRERGHDGDAHPVAGVFANHVGPNGGQWLVPGQLQHGNAADVGQELGLWFCDAELQGVDRHEPCQVSSRWGWRRIEGQRILTLRVSH